MELEVNSMAVPRKAKQAVGGIAKLTHDDGRQMTVSKWGRTMEDEESSAFVRVGKSLVEKR